MRPRRREGQRGGEQPALTAFDLFAEGMSMRHKARSNARTALRAAVTRDPGMADAWIALLLVGGDRAECLDGWIPAMDRVGRDSAAAGRASLASVEAWPFFTVPLEDPDSGRLAAAFLLVESQEWDRARAVLQDYAGPPAWKNTATAHRVSRQGRIDQGIFHAREALQTADPQIAPTLRLMLGGMLAQQRELEEALVHLRAVEQGAQTREVAAEASYLHALVLREQGDEEGARRLLQAASLLEPDLAAAREALTDPEHRLARPAVELVCRPGVDKDAEPQTPSPDQGSERGAHDLFAEGVRLLEHDRPEALAAFHRAVALEPDLTDAWLGVHAAGGATGEALDKMVAHLENLGAAQHATGTTLSSRGDIGAFVNLVMQTRDQILLCHACHATQQGRFDAAAASVERVEGRGDLLAFVRSRLEHWKGNIEKSASLARVAIEGGDRYVEVEARLLLGIDLARMREFHAALDELRWVADQSITFGAVAEGEHYQGLVLRAQGDETAAEQMFRRALEHHPSLAIATQALEDPTVMLNFVSVASPSVGAPAPEPDAQTVDAADTASETPAEILAELDGWVGLDDVKRAFRVLMAQVKGNLARAEHGIPQDRLTEHMVFVGPPGTGKTSLARMVARLYHALGVLERPTVVEADRGTLVGEHLGSTALKTGAVIDAALGGVLFIDEAYSLEQPGLAGGDAFGSEAVDTLLKRMEDERDRLVVIVAGYSEPMRVFLDSNDGFASRFTSTLRFPSYTPEELLEITVRIADRSRTVLGEGTHDLLRDHFERVAASGELDRLGNGRLARNLVEKAQRERDFRLFSGLDEDYTVEQLSTIEPVDVFAGIAAGGQDR